MGINLASVGTCFPHRADKALCALRPGLAHGQSVAFFYPYWVRSSYHAAPEKFAEVARIIAQGSPCDSKCDGAAWCAHVVSDFISSVGMSVGLHTVLSEEDVPALTACVAGDLSVNPVVVRREALSQMFVDMLREST
jgi:alcohol dehydrogenase